MKQCTFLIFEFNDIKKMCSIINSCVVLMLGGTLQFFQVAWFSLCRPHKKDVVDSEVPGTQAECWDLPSELAEWKG